MAGGVQQEAEFQGDPGSWRAPAHRLVTRPWFGKTITALIILNAILLGVETWEPAKARFGDVLAWLDNAILAVFVVEIALKITAYGARFFRSGWNWFDFTIVAISLVPASEAFKVLRSLRVLRVLRLLSATSSLRRVVESLFKAIPGMGAIVLVLGLLIYAFAVMSTHLFGEDFPERFGHLGASALTMFELMTLEGWSGEIVYPVAEVHPWAYAFFLPYIVIAAFAVLNLFIAIVTDSMASLHQEEAEEREDERLEDERTRSAALQSELAAIRVELAELKTLLAARPGAAG